MLCHLKMFLKPVWIQVLKTSLMSFGWTFNFVYSKMILLNGSHVITYPLTHLTSLFRMRLPLPACYFPLILVILLGLYYCTFYYSLITEQKHHSYVLFTFDRFNSFLDVLGRNLLYIGHSNLVCPKIPYISLNQFSKREKETKSLLFSSTFTM